MKNVQEIWEASGWDYRQTMLARLGFINSGIYCRRDWWFLPRNVRNILKQNY